MALCCAFSLCLYVIIYQVSMCIGMFVYLQASRLCCGRGARHLHGTLDWVPLLDAPQNLRTKNVSYNKENPNTPFMYRRSRHHIFYPRPDGGQRAPLWFFANTSQLVRSSAFKFLIPLWASILRILWKKNYLRSPSVKSYRGQTEIMFGRFLMLFQVKLRRAVDLQDTDSTFWPQT